MGFPDQRHENPETGPVVSSYWDVGTAGIGTTLVRYLAVVDDAQLEVHLQNIVAETSLKYTAFPQLFHGLVGLGNFLLDTFEFTGNEVGLAAAWQAAAGALLFQIDAPQGLCFPGEQAVRESADYATGTAGVALFIYRLLRTDGHSLTNFNFLLDDPLATNKSM